MTKRLFIGVPVSSLKAIQKVESWKNNSRMRLNKMSWVKPENWHITLYFLGDTPDEKVDVLRGFAPARRDGEAQDQKQGVAQL